MKKRMKILLFSTLVLLMCALFFTACDTESTPEVPNYENDRTTENINNGNVLESGDSENNERGNSINTGLLQSAYGYSNGLMLVRDESDYSFYFINKKGERIFNIPESPEKSYTFIYRVECFLGNYFPLEERDRNTGRDITVLLTEMGKIIRPEDVGVSDFSIDTDVAQAMLADGYILAKRVEETFMESKTELLVLDDEMNELISLSGVLEEDDLRHYEYFPGFLCYEDDYSDDLQFVELRTGRIYTNPADAYSKISLEYESDWWKYYEPYFGDSYFYDIRDAKKTPVLSTEILPETRYTRLEFSNGLSHVMFRPKASNGGWNYYFSIINEKGELLFEPAKISGDARIASYNGVYAVATTSNLYVFNKTGKIAEIQHEVDFSVLSVNVVFSENVIVLNLYGAGGSPIYIYTPELKPLFD